MSGNTITSGNTIAYNTTNVSNSLPTTEAIFQIFTDSNIVIIAWFLAVYFIVYLILNIVRGKEGATNSVSRWVDIVALGCLLIYLGVTYFGKTEEEKQQIIKDIYNQFKSYLNNPLSLISVAFFIFTLYIVIFILGIPMDRAGKPITITIIENTAWIFLVLIIIANVLRYISGASITDFMDMVGDNLQEKASNATINITGNVNVMGTTNKLVGNAFASSATTPVETNEVFNIGNNMFTYDDAQSVCASYGARLANYDEIETAYNTGGEWCNYGWSEGQSAYFPTQKKTWQNLQKSDKTKNACGRPGVNGGYIDNPNVRFGVNCFGKKPKPSKTDLDRISTSASENIPKSPEDILLEKKVKFWNENREKLLKVNSYNNNKWSMY